MAPLEPACRMEHGRTAPVEGAPGDRPVCGRGCGVLNGRLVSYDVPELAAAMTLPAPVRGSGPQKLIGKMGVGLGSNREDRETGLVGRDE